MEEFKMTTLTKIDRNALRLIDAEVTVAMTAIAEKFGLTYKHGSGRFSATTYRTSAEFALPADPETDRAEFARNAMFIRDIKGNQAFTEDDFGRTFVQNRRTYTVTGLHPNRPAYPVTATRDDGRGYKFPASMVRLLLDAAKK
jgi:hypothetical protein